MFDHERDSLAEAVGIEKEMLFQEFMDLHRRLMWSLEKDFNELGRVIEYLCEKPRILIATLLMTIRHQMSHVCSLIREPTNMVISTLGALAQGAGGAPEPYSMRPSEEVEVLSTLPHKYLATQTVLWGVNLLTLVAVLLDRYESQNDK